jgi:hypothetical protein
MPVPRPNGRSGDLGRRTNGNGSLNFYGGFLPEVSKARPFGFILLALNST